MFGLRRGETAFVVVPESLLREAKRFGFRTHGSVEPALLPFVGDSVEPLADVEARAAADRSRRSGSKKRRTRRKRS